MRILFVAPAKSVHSFRWIDFFQKSGCDIAWLSLHPATDSVLSANPSLRPQCVARSNRVHNVLAGLIRLRRLIKEFKPHIIHAHSVGPYGLLPALLGFHPFVATAWGSDVLVAGKSPWTGPFVRYILRSADIVTTDADHMISEMVGMGTDRTKLRRINFGIDADALTRLDTPDPEYSRRFRGEGNVPTVISLRNHYDVYDIATLLRAVPEIVRRVPNVRVIVAGRGPLTESLETMAAELHLGNNVDFIGGYDGSALRRIFSAVDVYVSTSLSDAGIAASTAEAMSCSVPVVVTNTGENDQWIQNGVNGFLFAARDHSALARYVVELLSDPERRTRVGTKGRDVIVERNNYRREMTKMLELYKELSTLD